MAVLELSCHRVAWFCGSAFAAVLLFVGYAAQAGETALDRYVAKPDKTYSWKIVSTKQENGQTIFIVDLKSQTWRSEKDVDRPVWQHWLTIVKPAKVAQSTAFLQIGGGKNTSEPDRVRELPFVSAAAQATNTVVAILGTVPNQPLKFHGDGKDEPRSEDNLIAYTWDQFLKTGDEEWPARLPMVKSAVRAMDCVQEVLASDAGGKVKIDKFVVSGGSKRGWTTWCTAAVDKRVIAAIPVVIDVINTRECSKHHIEVYGFYARAIKDYILQNIKQRTNDPVMDKLYAIEDPYSYRERLTMPKYIVNASGDQFFPPDSSQFYYDGLSGEKNLRYVPNAEHSLARSDARQSIIAFYQMILNGTPRPTYSWTFEPDGSIRVKTVDSPKSVTLWHATNPKARDFRVSSIGPAYKSEDLHDEGGGVFVGRITPPAEGWTAFFVELSYDVGAVAPLKLSTAVRVLPDKLPFAGIDPAKAPLEVEGRRAASR